MNREIKFRAWDKKKSMMNLPQEVDLSQKVAEIIGQPSYLKLPTLTKESELMQFTGLKDKNGKEIYEGDILSMHNGQYYSQVIWDCPEFRADHIGNGGSEAITTWIEDHEVIGNIYENPELIK